MIRPLLTERALAVVGLAFILSGCQAPPPKLVLPKAPVESGFAIDTDAFAFSNFGGSTNGSTMTPELASRLFGAESICAASSEMEGCRPTPIAREWIKKVNESMKGGRCEGFAVLSNLLFLGQLKPQDFGAEHARELTLSNNPALGKEIAYWFSTQYVSSVVGKSTVTLSAKEAVSFFAEEFAKNRGEMYRIGMVRIDDAGRMAGGHAMVPTGVGPGIVEGTYVIRVYDNNHPEADRQILIDAKSDRWEYQASSNPDKASSLYMGDATNKNRLFITSVSPRLGTHPCSFCEGATSEGAQVNQVFTMGGAEVSATNEEGQTAGIVEGRIVNGIEGAFVTPSFTVDPWDDDAPVSMVLPSAAGSTKLSLAGRGGAEKAQVTLFAAGSATGVEGLIPVGAADTLTLTAGGAGMKYAPSSGSAPQIFMARQTNLGTQTMVKLQIPAGLGVSGVSMEVDKNTGDVSLAARGMGNIQLDVSITRSAGGGEDEFVGVVEAPESGSVQFEVAAWAGEGSPIEATVDVDGDGTADQTVEVVPTGPAGEAPASPISLVASAMGPDLVSLSWTDQSAGEESFEIERDAMGGGTFVALATLPPNASSLDDSAVRHSASYRYRVRAVNRYGASAWSNEADVTLPGCLAGRQDEDGDGQCQPDCATAGLSCGSFGQCSAATGTAACVCEPGYLGARCDQCAVGFQDADGNGTCLPTCATAALSCDGHGTCSDVSGTASCVCEQGYAGTGTSACVDVDECATAHGGCDALSACTNTPGSRSCGACPAGYAGTGETSCVDVDECATNNGGCDSLSSCTNTPGGRSCGSCPAGYTGTGGTACVDVDECATAHGGCDALASCMNTPGARLCGACPVGYSGSGETACVDVDECASAHGGCDALASCTNTPGARTCGACPVGYSGSGETSCVDVDECATANGGCDALASCTNTPGARTCGACPAGYTGSGETACVDVDECATGHGGCDALASCTNTPGARTCGACPAGYTGTGETACVDVDECAVAHGGCDALATCTNTPGARTCGLCPSGYVGSGETSCTDVDECLTTNGGCDALSTCTNTPGFRTCGACPSGYTGTGETICFDVDECATANGGCDVLSVCSNTPGARTCGACPAGYSGDGETACVDVDECASNHGGCDALATCTNTAGARTCGACPSGYTGTGETTCVDVDECAMTNGGCDALTACTNTPGFRTCGACPSGYSGTGDLICFNIDECTELTDDCHAQATCTDTVGGFTCACNAGFSGTGQACEPTTGCHVDGGHCDVNASCFGTGPTTNTCTCNGGFVGNGQTCEPRPASAVTFRQAARWVGPDVGTVSIDVVRSYFHEGDATVPYTLSGACQKANQNGNVYFAQGQPWLTLDLPIDPTCVVGDTLVVTLGLPSSSAAVTPVLGQFAVHTVNVTAVDPCTTGFPQLLIDSRDDLDADGIPDRCDVSLAPAGKVSRFVPASSVVASNEYGNTLAARNMLSVTVNAAPAAATYLFTHDWRLHWNDSGSWLTSQNELTQWFTVAFDTAVAVDEFSMVNFSATGRNLEWMRGIKDFRVYGSNTIATAPVTRASADPAMALLGTYSALSFNDRSWMEGGEVKGLPQVFRVSPSAQYQYYHFEFTSSQRTDWSGHYPGDLSGLRRIEFARYTDDGCLTNHGGCDANATCADQQGQVTCTCSVGFYGDGQSCAVLAEDPRVVPGLDVWVAADVGLVMNGSTVATWQDLSGHHHHFQQPNVSQQPSVVPVAMGGRPALEFHANQQQSMGLAGQLNSQTTICYVARISGPTAGRVLSSLNSNWLMGWWGGGADQAHFEEWVYQAGAQPNSNQVVYCGVMSGTQSRFYKDGVQLAATNNGRAPNGLSLGGYNGSSEFSDAQVAELLVYRAALSPSAVAQVNAYLLNKYPSCTDGLRNGAEVDIDCGGGCGTCADNKRCTAHGDCTNGVCDADSQTCGPPGVRTYDFNGLEQSLVLPAGRTINVKVWGAGGQNSGYTQLGGGAGGFTSGQLVGSGQTLKISVGRGAMSSNGPVFGGGGKGGTCGPSGGGGGLSKVALADGTLLFVAGGGGGAGPGQGAYGGGGCGLNGGGTGVAVGGLGGTLTSGYAPFLGADADDFGAAGGGGYFGGAKGSGPSCDVGGGGGGGSCYLAPSVIAPLQLAAMGTIPATDTKPWVRGNAGQGGVTWYAPGTDGRVVISWKTGVSCSVNNGLCDVNATCTDSGQGTVSCACDTGFAGDGASCVNVTAPPAADLNVWVAADRGLVMNGSTVATWLDQSGHGNDFVQADANRQPIVAATGIGGLPALQFSASFAQTLIMATNLPPPVTVCYVARMSGPNHGRILSGLNNNWLLGWHGGSMDRAYFEGWVWPSSVAVDAAPLSHCAVISTTSSTVSKNGVQVAEVFGGYQGPNGLSVVGHAGVSEFSDAQVAEILVYGAALSGAQRAHVETYLTSKYGL